MFQVGQSVVCVDAKRTPVGWFGQFMRWCLGRDWLVECRIYTISKYHADLFGMGPCVELLEVRNSWIVKGSFRACRFRPITERKTDISVFTEILDKVSQGDRKLIGAE